MASVTPRPARWSRRRFVAASLRTAAGLGALGATRAAALPSRRPLLERFPDARRHFVFEYYPWYRLNPVLHWDQWSRKPPVDIAANHVPRLGAYESGSFAVLEQHARWIVEAGVGAVNLSWWGADSYENAIAHRVLDVMNAHGLKATFHLEPYTTDRSRRYVDDILYLLREYGEKRHWDALLVLRDEDGREGPVFKSFATILPEEVTDCHGQRHRVSGYTADGDWARQVEAVRHALRHDFDHVRLLADSQAYPRAAASGFDGVAIYDNFLRPEDYFPNAHAATTHGLLFSFNVNPGFDAIEPREVEPGSCYAPRAFAPRAEGLDWRTVQGRERAAELARARMAGAMEATVRLQGDLRLANAARGFFLVYLNSFNEWHEGHAIEPMKDYDALTPEERALGYHNPADGGYRLAALRRLVAEALVAVREPRHDERSVVGSP